MSKAPRHRYRFAREHVVRNVGLVGLVGLVVLGVLPSCRGIAGIDDFTYVPDFVDAASDAQLSVDGGHDGGSAADSGACNVTPTVIYSTTDTLYGVFLQGGRLFFETFSAANNSTSVASCDPANCVAITPYILADPTLWTEDITNTHIYWSDVGAKLTDGGPAKNGSISVITWPGDAGPKTAVSSALNYPNYLRETADESQVFFTDDPNNDFTVQPGPATLLKCTLPTCASPVLWGSGFFTTYAMVMGASRVFFMASSDLAGSKKALLACSQTAPCDMPPKKLLEGQALNNESFAESNDSIFITSADQNAIIQIAPSGAITTFAANQTTPASLGIDSGWVYWFAVTQSQGKSSFIADLRRKKLDGSGSVETLLCGLNTPSQVHFDLDHVYIAEASTSASTKIERIPKPK